MTPPPAVEVVDLVKQYPKNPVLAVDKISFAVGPGEVFGLLGPNGAGKTTTIGVLTTRVRPTSGEARVAGVDVVAKPVEARRHLAVVPQRNNLDRSLSIRQNLLFHAAYHGVPAAERMRRADELLGQFGLAERANDRVDMFSGGQAQRAMIARALMHSPEVLFLDEPSTGLDPAARLFVWDRIRELKQQGVTIILTTHDMDEAATLADRVGIMDHGHVLSLGTPEELTTSLPGSATLEISVAGTSPQQSARLIADLNAMAGVERVEVVTTIAPGPSSSDAGGRFRLYLSTDPATMVGPVATAVAGDGAVLGDVRIAMLGLEDVFISLTGRSLR